MSISFFHVRRPILVFVQEGRSQLHDLCPKLVTNIQDRDRVVWRISFVSWAAGVQEQRAVHAAPERGMRMSIDDQVHVVELLADHFLLNIDLPFTMDQSNTEGTKSHHLFERQNVVYAYIIHIACHCLDWGYGPELIQNGKLYNIPGMKDQVDVLEYLENRRRQGRHNGWNMGI
jgi:hypothetical protein